MDTSNIPFLPLSYFFRQFSRPHRLWFLALAAAGLLTTAAMLFSWHNPEYFALKINEISELSSVPVTLSKARRDYLEYPVIADAWQARASYSAGPLQPAAAPLWAYALLQVLGWAVFLASATLVRSRWVYAFYFPVALYVHFSGFSRQLLANETLSWGLELLIVLLVLGLAYAFQMNLLRARFGALVGIFALIFGGLYAAVALKAGWTGLHAVSAGHFPLMGLLALPFFFFVAKEPVNLLMAALNHHAAPARRIGLPGILLASGIWLLLSFIMLNEHIGLSFLPKGFFLKPIHLLAISLLAVAVTAQNHYHFVREAIGSGVAYTFLLQAGIMLAGSHLALLYAEGDFAYREALDRLLAIFFFSVSAAYVIFILFNHRQILRQRVAAYFLLTQGPVARFIIVWLMALIVLVAFEGSRAWVSIAYFAHSREVQEADRHLLSGDTERAALHYGYASALIVNSIKAHYNFAALSLTGPEQLAGAFNSYQKVKRYPYASLNAAQLLLLSRQEQAATALLERQYRETPNAYIANNLALLHWKNGQPDSAIVRFKDALRLDPGLSSAFSNLGMLYLQYGKTEAAREFLQAAVAVSRPGTAALTNALWYNLEHEQKLRIKNFNPENHQDEALSFNHLLSSLPDKSPGELRKTLRTMLKQGESPQPAMLDALLMFGQDSIAFAITRADYVNQLFPAYAARANYLMGVSFFERGAPEMARRYFLQAAAAGDSVSALYAAQMDMEAGRRDSAFISLSQLRVRHPGMWKPVSKELGLLLLAVGQGLYAQTEFGGDSLGTDDKMRAARYADSTGQFANALELYRQVLEKNPADIRPYRDMARTYTRYGNATAIGDLEQGLKVAPGNAELLTELAAAYLRQGKLAEAESAFAAMPANDALNTEQAIVRAGLLLARKDTASAIGLLDGLIQADPLNSSAILQLAAIYRAGGQSNAGLSMIGKALEINTENPGLWYYYAVFSRMWGQSRDAGYGALRAIQLSVSPAEARRIQAEFQAEILEVAGK